MAPITDDDWFEHGWSVYKGELQDDKYFPPLNDMKAQRWWLAGFGAAWAESPEDEAIDSILSDDGMGGESVDAALLRAMQGRADLLRQLRAYGASDAGSSRVH